MPDNRLALEVMAGEWLVAAGRSLVRTGNAMSAQTRIPPSMPVLDGMIPHVAFEFAALEKTFATSLEGFLLHTRVLREFFYGDPESRFADSAVFAEDYSTTWKVRVAAGRRGWEGRRSRSTSSSPT